MVEASWLEADGTLVRVETHQGDLRIDVLDQLEPISEQELARLLDDHGVDPGPPPEVTDGSETDGSETDGLETPIARAETAEGDVIYSATVLSGGRRQLELRTFTEGPNGGSGSGRSLTDLSTNTVIGTARQQ